nr:nucleoporin [Quercus suber]
MNRIASLKGRPGSQRGSRQASPAVGPVNAFNPQQTFQPPQTGSFDFAFGGNNTNNNTPTFGQQPPPQPQQNGGFSFGASTPAQPAMPAQPNGTGLFGSQTTNATSSFSSSSFGASNTQPQQNGFAPATSSIFGTQNTTSTAPTNPFSFGQSQPEPSAQSNKAGSTPSLSFGGQANGSNGFSFGASKPVTEENKGTTSSFTGFGASQQGQKEATPSFGGFGASQLATQTPKPATPAFGGFAAQPSGQPASTAQNTSSIFSGLAKGTEQSANTAGEKPKSIFGLGATTAPAEPSAVKAGDSIFSGLAQPSIKPGMFTQSAQNGEATSTPSNLFNFGAANSKSLTPASAKTTSSLFGFGQSAPATGAQGDASKAASTCDINGQPIHKQQDSPFKFAPSQAETPKAPINIFQQFGNSQANATPAAISGLSEDTSMQSPENTPKKPSEKQGQIASTMFSGFSSAQTPAPSTGKSLDLTANAAEKPRSMFDRLEKPADTNVTPKPAFSFAVSAATPPQQTPSAMPQTEKPISRHEQHPAPPATEPRPSTSLFPTTQPNATTAFKPIPAAPATNTISTSTNAPRSTISQAQRNDIRSVNTGFLHTLKHAELGADWSSFALSYLTEITKLRQKPVSTVAKAPAPASVDSDATPKAPAFTNIFKDRTPSNNSLRPQSTQPPATAPVSKKRPADEHLTKAMDAPTTEKRVRAEEPIEYPKLSENASKSAKLFESVLDKSSSGTPKFGPPDHLVNKVREDAANKADSSKSTGFTPSTTSLFSGGFKPSTTLGETTSSTTPKAAFGFTPSASSSADARNDASKAVSTHTSAAAQAATEPASPLKFGFVPSASASAAAATKSADTPKFGFAPTASSSTTAAPSAGMPTFAAPATGAGGFLSAFGKKAEANAESEKKKRKAEDYDSEEDDEAEWEAKYAAEQEEKRRKIEAASKSGTAFGFKPAAASDATTKPSPSAFSFGQSKPAATQAEPPKVSAQELEKQTGTGDKTWQPKTPIKFGTSLNTPASTTPAAAPPSNPFGGLFGSGSQTPAANKPEALKPAPPSVGFSFAPQTPKLGASRTTPTNAVTHEGDSSAAVDGEPSDSLNDKQVEDMTALLPEERAEHDVLLEIPICKASKFMPKQNEEGKSAMAWVERGKGPLYILRNRSSGKTSVLLKVPPLGKVAMNFLLLGGNAEYKLAQGRTKHVSGPFVDYLEGGASAKKPSSWLMQVGQPEQAKEMARLMQENRPTD